MKKRFISFLICTVLCMGLLVMPSVSYAQSNIDFAKLYAFGILDNIADDNERTVTRAEMVKYAVSLYGVSYEPLCDTVYSDVTKEHEYSGAVRFAHERNIISGSDKFYPDKAVKFEEAVKMIVCALEYSDLANQMGGYPYGYIDNAYSLGLLNNVTAGVGTELTWKETAHLLDNALESEICNKSMIVSKDNTLIYEYPKTTTDDGVLRKRFGVSKYKAFITDISEMDKSLKADIISKEKDDTKALYGAGESVSLDLVLKSSVPDCKYTYSEIYVNNNGEVLYIDVDKKTEVLTGVIYEVNKTHNNEEFIPAYIENIAFEDSEDYMDIAENCIMKFDGKDALNGTGYSYIGSFARVVLHNDEIIALEAWELKEGGLITSFSDNTITYSQGEKTGLLHKNINSYKDLKIYINGEKSEHYALIPDVVFDWYSDSDTMIIVASTNAVTDTFNTVGENSLNIGGDEYALTEKYSTYYSSDGINYTPYISSYDLLGNTVTAYVDFAGYIRYVKPFLKSKTEERYAIFAGYSQKGLSDEEFEVYTIIDGVVEKNIYALSESLSKNKKDLIDTIKNNIISIYNANAAQKNELIKSVNLLYMIRVNDKNKITDIQNAVAFKEPTISEDGFSVGEMGASSSPFIKDPYIQLTNAKYCAFYYSGDEGITVRSLKWSDIQAKSVSGIKFNVYAKDESYVDLMLLRGDVSSITYSSGYFKYGLCTKILTGYDAEKGEEVLTLTIDGNEYSLLKFKDKFAGVTERAFITYVDATSFWGGNEIRPDKVFNLSGDPEKWVLNSITRDSEGIVTSIESGIHKDELRKVDSVRAYFASGDAWYMNSGASVYEVVANGNSSKIIKRERGEVPTGIDVWYIYYGDQIRALFYVN